MGRRLTWSLAFVLFGALIVSLFPVFWIVITAIKPPTDWNASPAIWFPSHPTLVNFRTLFDPDAIRAYGVGGVSQAATTSVYGCAPCKGGAFQGVRPPPGNRSSRKQSEQSWR